MKKNKILLVANNAPPVRGGSSMVYAELARHANGNVILMAPKRSYIDGLSLIGWRDHDRLVPYRVTRVELLRTRMGMNGEGPLRRLAFFLSDLWIRVRLLFKILILLAWEPIGTVCIGELVPSAWLLRILRFWPGLKCAVYVHGEEITTADEYDPDWSRRRRALESADVIFTVSRFTTEAVRGLLRGTEKKLVKLIENGVDSQRFAPAPRRSDLKILYGLNGKFIFLTVCRLLEKKGVDQAIRAFSKLYGGDRSCCYLIVGAGPYAEALVKLTEGLAVKEQVVFVGEVPEEELPAHFHLADVFVMPNRALPDGDTEGFGLVFLEANAAGIPVIAGQDGGSVDAVKHGVNGVIVDGRSVEGIMEAMSSLRNDRARRSALAEQGLRHAARMDWKYKAAEFVQICNEAAAI
jgi:phosphatidylinositol alpha-1,6-mannosyltransferase